MKITSLLILLLFTTSISKAQLSVSELTESQRNSLQIFLSQNSQYQFIPETWFDEDNLRYARFRWGFGRNFRPYYQRGDFNGDQKMDFAMLLLNTSRRSLHVVVFNQIPGLTYRVVHNEDVGEFHSSLFISQGGGRLFYGVLETEICGSFFPTRNGYIVEACR